MIELAFLLLFGSAMAGALGGNRNEDESSEKSETSTTTTGYDPIRNVHWKRTDHLELWK